MAGWQNNVGVGEKLALTRTSSGEWALCNDGTDEFGFYNYAGSPEGNVTANTGSYCCDTTNGNIYQKTTDSANTGWRLLPKLGGTSALTDGSILIVDSNGDITELGPLAKGEVIVGDGSGAPTLLTAGSDEQVLTVDSGEASGVKWADAGGGGGGTISGYLGTAFDYDDFTYSPELAGVTGKFGKFNWHTSGNIDYNTSGDVESGHPGIVLFTQFSNVGNRSCMIASGDTNSSPFILGAGTFTFTWVMKIPELSTSAHRAKVFFGMASFPNSEIYGTDPDDGIFFTFVDDENSGNWILNNRSSSTSTTSNTSTAADTDWHSYSAVVNSAATSVEFFIDNVSQGTIATNIPTAQIAPWVRIDKESGTGTDRIIQADFFGYEYALTTNRLTN